DVVEEADVGGRRGAGRAPDRGLVDLDGAREVLRPFDGAMGAHAAGRQLQRAADPTIEDVAHERRLARAGDARAAGPGAERDADVEVAEVVLAGAAHGEPGPVVERPARSDPRPGRREVATRDGRGHGRELRGWRDRDDATALDAGARAQVDDQVG